METKYIQIDSVGQVAIRINPRSQKIRLTVGSPNEAFVSIPSGVSYKEAIRFVESKSSWIIKQQNKLAAGLTIFTPESCFKTMFHRLAITVGQFDKVSNRVGNGIIQVLVPEKVDLKSQRIQEFIRKTLFEVIRYEAKNFLPKRLKELGDKHGFRFNEVRVKNAKTRWGSCSSKNNINLNLHLMRLPEHLIDYVLLHELAHTVEKNHGKKFWALLEKHFPETDKARGELKKYNTHTF